MTMLTQEEIQKRLVDLDNLINNAIQEKNQLIGYKQALIEANNEKISGNAQENGDEVRHKSDKVKKGSNP
jgi:CHASE3 domain sensor protein